MKTTLSHLGLAALAAAGCRPTLSAATIANHPALSLELLQPQTVETSDPVEPFWVRTPHRKEADAVSFTGQSFARTMDEAKAEASRDLLAAVSSFVSVDVQAASESRESVTVRDGVTMDEQLDASSVVRTQTAAKLRGVEAEAFYWEKIAASALTPDSVSYRYWVHARVPRGEIALARLQKQLGREQQTGSRMVAVLPFRPALAEAPPPGAAGLADAFLEELSRRLDAADALYVVDPTLVRSLAADPGAGEAELVAALRDALVPDWVVGGTYQLVQGKVRVTYTIYGAGGAAAKAGATGVGGRQITRTFDRPYRELFALEDDLVAALAADLATGAAPGAGLAPRAEPAAGARAAAPEQRSLAAFELYHAAYAEYAAGQNEQALETLRAALAAQPSYAAAALRLGRVLERLGRYGRVPAIAAASPQAFRQPVTCAAPWHVLTDQTPEEFFAVRELVPADTGVDLSWQQGAGNVDHVLFAALFVAEGGPVPRPEVSNPPRAAADAYWQALAWATEQQDRALANEALLALADLAVRVDRLSPAEKIFQALLARGTATRDLSLASFANYGLGRVRVRQGRLEEADLVLREALAARAVLGEKPYLLEIFNELGNVSVQRSRLAEALARYAAAKRLAEELDNDYLRAVLSNNLGVLELLRGHTAVADEQLAVAWDFLHQLAETEGQIAAGLNLAHVGAVTGDLERARAYLAEVRRIVAATQQESSLAALYNHQGYAAALSGEHAEAFRRLLRAWATFDRLGRTADALRVRNNLAVEDFGAFADRVPSDDAAFEQDRESLAGVLACLRRSFFDLMSAGHGVWVTGLDPYGDYSGGGFWRSYDEMPMPFPGPPVASTAGAVLPGSLPALIARLNAESIAAVQVTP